jgi:molecular chaperone IbpA
MEDYFDRLAELNGASNNYPPYNLVQVSNVEYRLELALAGFKKTDVKVYTEHGRLFVEGKKEGEEHSPEYLHRGVAQRSFSRAWSLSDETEIRSVEFEDGMLVISLGKIVPEHHQRKDYL